MGHCRQAGTRRSLRRMRRETPVRHCPRCGFAVGGASRFCPACAFDFWGAAAGQTPASTTGQSIPVPIGASGRTDAPSGASVAVLVGGVLIAAGSWLPWLSTGAEDFGAGDSGMAGGGDGWITLLVGIGIVLLALVNLRQANEFNRLAVWLLGGTALFVFWMNLDRVQRAVTAFDSTARGMASAAVGIGLWAVALGAIVAMAFNIGRPASGVTLRALFRRA